MINIIESWAAGQYKILFWFLAAIILVYIPFMFLYLHKRKEKGRLFEHSHKDAVKLYFNIDLKGTLQIYSVNGGEPVFFYEIARQGIYLLPGENVLGLQYYWSERSMFSLKGFKDFNIPPQELEVFIEPGKKYSIGYNHQKETYEFDILK